MNLIDRKEAIKSLKNNELVILPTDTVYGVMAKFNAKNEIKINKFKKSDINKKISIIFYNKKEILKYLDKLSFFRKCLLYILLPGKYTFIVNLKKELSLKYGFSRTDFGVRITKNRDLQSIIKETGPLLATSCNKSGNDVCLELKDIKKEFNEEKIGVYYTKSLKNRPSTIINLISERIVKIR